MLEKLTKPNAFNTAHDVVGIIGAGRMGSAIADRIVQAGGQVALYDVNAEASVQVAHELGERASASSSLEHIASSARVFWVMVPAGAPTSAILTELASYAHAGDIIIDAGNSNFQDSVRHAKNFSQRDMFFLDCGTSGGVRGREIGFALMIGGMTQAYEALIPLFTIIAAPHGYAHVGPSGAGHYVKMVHNGIEYALLQSYAEGYQLLRAGAYPELDLAVVARVWQHGSIIRSFINELCVEVLMQDQKLTDVSGAVGELGTGAWTLNEAHERGIPMKLLEDALAIRKWSRETGGDFSTKLVAMIRLAFGGHPLGAPGAYNPKDNTTL